jgi:hypothetical protein
MAVPFDATRLETKGAAVPVAEGISLTSTVGGAQYSFSSTGTLLYVSVESRPSSASWRG